MHENDRVLILLLDVLISYAAEHHRIDLLGVLKEVDPVDHYSVEVL